MKSVQRIAVILLFAVALISVGCDLGGPAPMTANLAPSDAIAKANFDAQVSGNQVQLAIQQRITTVQMDVAKRCADRGNIPVYVNQNVLCNPAPK